jgi:hypothetical protein
LYYLHIDVTYTGDKITEANVHQHFDVLGRLLELAASLPAHDKQGQDQTASGATLVQIPSLSLKRKREQDETELG